MAKPAGHYKPHSLRARKLIRQLRRATHKSVQHAIIRELIHEIERGGRRIGGQARKLTAKLRQQAGRITGRQPRRSCSACGRTFRNDLQFAAHGEHHAREARERDGRAGASRGPERTQHDRARGHARDHLVAAGRVTPDGRAVPARQRPGPDGRYAYDTEVGRITGDRPLSERELRDVVTDAKEAKRRHEAGELPDGRYSTTRVNGSLVHQTPAPGSTGRAADSTDARARTAPGETPAASRAPAGEGAAPGRGHVPMPADTVSRDTPDRASRDRGPSRVRGTRS